MHPFRVMEKSGRGIVSSETLLITPTPCRGVEGFSVHAPLWESHSKAVNTLYVFIINILLGRKTTSVVNINRILTI